MNLFVILFIAAVALIIVRRARQFLRSMVPPSRIHLAAVQPTSAHARDLKRYTRDLERRGFTRIGTYRVDPMRGVMLTAFTHTHDSLCAIVYTHPVAGAFIDVASRSEDGRSFTVTTAPAGKELDQREGHEKMFDKDMRVDQMVEAALHKRQPGPYVGWKAGNFVQLFEDTYAREMDWRAGRGGVTQDEVRRTAEAMGGKYSEHDVQEATHRLQRQYAAMRKDVR